MKKLIIILVVVGLTFVGLLVYGASSEKPASSPPGECKPGAPPPMDGDEPDADAMEEGWCPPSLAEKTKPLQARFAPGIKIERPLVEINNLRDETRGVPADPGKDMRGAKLRLVEGDRAIVEGRSSADTVVACLCRVNSPVQESEFAGCSKKWIAKQSGRLCQPDNDSEMLGFDELGGTLVFKMGPRAKVRVE